MENENLKTLKCRIFPSSKQKKTINEWFGVSRWVYNNSLSIVTSLTESPLYKRKEGTTFPNYTKYKIKNEILRDFIRKVETNETIEQDENYIYRFVDHVYNEDFNPMFDLPSNMEKTGFVDRAFRGVIKNLVGNINSCISNKGNISNLKPRTKKAKGYFIPFESWNTDYLVPAKIGKLKGHYKIGRRKILLEELSTKIERKSFSIYFEKHTQRYYLLCPVTPECFDNLKDDYKSKKVNEIQINFPKREVAVLDPGVRTFQTIFGLDHVVGIGENDLVELNKLFQKLDSEKTSSKRKVKIRLRLNNLVDELHWKTITYLTTNYENIIIPEFPISKMVKSKKLHSSIKRLMYAFKFYQFRMRLENKGKEKGCKIIIVTEEFTSKTCGCCGVLNEELGKSKIFRCPNCKIEIDRDINGARNILIKNVFS